MAHLRRIAVRAIVDQTGLREEHALTYADAVIGVLQAEYGGGQLYVPAPPRQYDVLQIRAALERGVTRKQICAQFHISRRTLDRMFPPESGGAIKTANDVEKIAA